MTPEADTSRMGSAVFLLSAAPHPGLVNAVATWHSIMLQVCVCQLQVVPKQVANEDKLLLGINGVNHLN